MAARSAESAARWPTGGPAPSVRIARPVLLAPRNRESTDPEDESVELDSAGLAAVDEAAAAAAALRASSAARCFWFWVWRRCLDGCRFVDMAHDVRRASVRGTFGQVEVLARYSPPVAQTRRVTASVLVTIFLLVAGCSGDDGPEASPEDTTEDTSVDTPPYQAVVEALAADEMDGRDNQTPGSVLAQEYLIGQLSEFAEPVTDGASGADAYLQPFAEGANVLALIPGGDRADEYVILGAHYDHLGTQCRGSDPEDGICNGAGDNAAGVAAVLEVGRLLAADDEPPSRSVILAFWDAEEDGLLGAEAYVADPEVPLDSTIAYLNWDIQGVNLAPSVADVTIMVGAETGGPNLVAAAKAATSASSLQTVPFSLLFGQGRSDHAVFASAGVPTVFFTDANSGCYHTTQDDTDVIDFDKLGQQILTAEALTRDLVATAAVPAFVAGTPPATFEDAESMLSIVSQGQEDLGLLPGYETAGDQFLADLEAMVAAGPDAFDDQAVGTLLNGSVGLVEALASSECDGYLG